MNVGGRLRRATVDSRSPLRERLPHSLQNRGPPGEQGKRRRGVGGKRVDQKVAIRRDIILPAYVGGGNDARLEEHARRAGRPLLGSKLTAINFLSGWM
jgi:hypothetical protein